MALGDLQKEKVKVEMPCFAAHNPKIDAYVKTAGKKKISLIINNVKVSEIKAIMEFILELRSAGEE